MECQIRKAAPLKFKTPCLIIGACEKNLKDPLLKELDEQLDGQFRAAVRSGEFSGKRDELLLLRPAKGQLPAERVLVTGLGPKSELSLEAFRRAAGKAISALRGQRLKQAGVALAAIDLQRTTLADRLEAVAEGLLLAGYRFDQFLEQEAKDRAILPDTLNLLVSRSQEVDAAEVALQRARSLCRAVALARTLVNQPGNVKSPAWLAEQAQTAAAEAGMSCTVLGREALEREGCGAMLGVAQGSAREPRLIIMEHHGGAEGDAPVVLVGKGVVFDTGGISLKPADKMDEMKMDMAGGAAVIGTLLAAALLDLPVNLVGLVPAVENMPSGTAIRPGDILTSLSGKTIEVLNTDAEGRLILADALTYAKRYQPRLVIDLATLTGACIIALGHHASAVLGNDQKLVQALLDAGEGSGERLWQLPLWEAYDQQIKSEVAEVKNIGGRPAGTITAAAFLQRFASEFRWAHLDIAGTAWLDEARPYIPKGGTGVGVRLLISFLRNLKQP